MSAYENDDWDRLLSEMSTGEEVVKDEEAKVHTAETVSSKELQRIETPRIGYTLEELSRSFRDGVREDQESPQTLELVLEEISEPSAAP